jgi:ribokinase
MRQPGGAILYMALAARLWELRVGIVTRIGEDYPREHLAALAAHGVELDGVRSIDGPGLRTWLLYEGRVRRVVHRLGGATHLEASPTLDDLPAAWSGRAVHLAPMPFALQLELARGLTEDRHPPSLLSLDPFELLTEEGRGEWNQLLAQLDVFFISEDEMVAPAATTEPRALLERLAVGRLGTVIYKQGARGGLAYSRRDRRYYEWPGQTVEVRDATGAGDAFAGGVLAGLLLGDPLSRALHRGAVTASFAIEAAGAAALLGAEPAAARRRLHEWFEA